MATRVVRECDVYGTYKGVESVRLTLAYVVDGDAIDVEIEAIDADLSPRALERLRRWIRRGLSKPSDRVAKKAEEEKG